MSTNGKKIKVKYIGKQCYEFDNGQICEAGFLRNDPKGQWYVIKGRGGDDEYAFPRELFEIVEG